MSETVDTYATLWKYLRPEALLSLDRLKRSMTEPGRTITVVADECTDEFKVTLSISGSNALITRQIEVRLMCADLHEGEEGGNISVQAFALINDDWETVLSYQPYNYTEDVWTTDPDELLGRFYACDLSEFAAAVLR